MTERIWIKTRYFKRVPTVATCAACGEPFQYIKTSKRRKYCGPCRHEVKLKQMRICNEFIRQLGR